jgi:hypothetical protein
VDHRELLRPVLLAVCGLLSSSLLAACGLPSWLSWGARHLLHMLVLDNCVQVCGLSSSTTMHPMLQRRAICAFDISCVVARTSIGAVVFQWWCGQPPHLSSGRDMHR